MLKKILYCALFLPLCALISPPNFPFSALSSALVKAESNKDSGCRSAKNVTEGIAGKKDAPTLYEFSVTTSDGEEKTLAEYRGKVLLIVNTASKCGFTPQYAELQALYEKYREQGLVILGFPCNQFAGQEPGSNEEVKSFCRLNYGVSFPLFAKGDVRGNNAQPLFTYLTKQKGFKGFDEKIPASKALLEALQKYFPEYLEGDAIKWNFTKFLIDRDGKVVARFEPPTPPLRLAADIEKLL